MATQISTAELTDDEYDEIDRMLARIKGGEIPNAETLDGFLTALVVCPDLVKPSEYFEVITGGANEDGDLVFKDMAEAERFYGLLMRHWNMINDTFRHDEFYMPFMKENEDGIAQGNDWASGFIKGTHLRHEIWKEAVNDEKRGGAFVPIWALAYEHASDPSLRPFNEPVTAEKREELLVAMIAGVGSASSTVLRMTEWQWQSATDHPAVRRRKSAAMIRALADQGKSSRDAAVK